MRKSTHETSFLQDIFHYKSGMPVHIYNPGTREAQVGGLEFKDNLGYTVRPRHPQKNKILSTTKKKITLLDIEKNNRTGFSFQEENCYHLQRNQLTFQSKL
jgi:hypothetical protein